MNRTPLSKSLLLGKDDSLLVIIDMQERLLPVMAESERVLENVIKLIKFSNIIGLPVVLTEQQKLGDTVPEIRQHLMNIQAISKSEFNCFGSQNFTERIKQLNRNSLIISGIEAHVCVAQTALHAVPHFTTHVVSDAISSRSLHNWEVSLKRMGQQGVTITSTEMFIFELLEKAGTDIFREVLRIVK
ncbi:MAG: isochorismatase family protein [Pseudomonadota bacterium]